MNSEREVDGLVFQGPRNFKICLLPKVTLLNIEETVEEEIKMDNISSELLNLMKQMQTDMKKNNDGMKHDNDELRKELTMGLKVVTDEVKTFNSKIEQVMNETEAVKNMVQDAKLDSSARFARMEERLDMIELEKKKIEVQKRKRDDLRKTLDLTSMNKEAFEDKNVVENLGAIGGGGRRHPNLETGGGGGGGREGGGGGGKVKEIESFASAVRGGDRRSRIISKEKVTERESASKEQSVTVEKVQFKSNWAREMSQISLESQLKLATKAAEENEQAKREGRDIVHKVKPKHEKKPLKLGDSIERHEENDWPWEENLEDWDGTMEKVEKNKIKKDKEKKKNIEKIEKAARVGQCTIGIGPIKGQSFEYFYKITGDFPEAQKMAAVEFLQEYLKFDSEDLTDCNITDTKISRKGDDILFIVFDSPDIVKNIRRRIADCQNDHIRTREYVPPQFFNRHNAVSKYAAEMREKDRTLKTQIRWTNNDIVLMTKTRGTDEAFTPITMTEIAEIIDLPRIEYNLVWNRKPDRPAWRNVSPSNGRIHLKSLGRQTNGTNGTNLRREESPKYKKSKHQLSADSSDSNNEDDLPRSPAAGNTEENMEEESL